MPATTPADRRRLLARSVADHRSRDADVAFHGRDGDHEARVTYGDRVVAMDLAHAAHPQRAARDALEETLADYPVFKLKQPETRKARTGEVYVSALADAKHAADFIETCFREVYGLGPEYELTAGTDGADDHAPSA
jgi:hypothetical protein